MTHIFISYAKKDTRELALSLADALNDIDGVTVWVDRSLRAGRSWELQIQAEIDKCDTMVVLYSPDINRHKKGKPESYVLTEIAYAKYTVNKPIIPVMAQDTTPPISLTTAHYIDFTLSELTLDDLVKTLCDEVGIDRAKPKKLPDFTKREREIIPFLCAGNRNVEIANELVIAETTAKSHRRQIYQKLNAKNRTEALLRMQELGLCN